MRRASLGLVDVVVPNESELALLTGTDGSDPASAAGLLAGITGAGAVVVTLGERGALVWTPAAVTTVGPHAVAVVDTVGAGDAFCGMLAARLAGGASLLDAVRHANAAGALATTRAGAGPSMPTIAEVEQLLGGVRSGVWDRTPGSTRLAVSHPEVVVADRDRWMNQMLEPMAREARAAPELAAFVATVGPLIASAPRGDGHPVLVLPGLGGGDTVDATAALVPRSPRLPHRRLGPGHEHGSRPAASPAASRSSCGRWPPSTADGSASSGGASAGSTPRRWPPASRSASGPSSRWAARCSAVRGCRPASR